MIDPFDLKRNIELQRGDVVFVGEGGDDCALLRHLTHDWKQTPVFLTRNPDANSNWETQFRAIVQLGVLRRIASIALLFDAETNRKRQVELLGKMFEAAELPTPLRPGVIKKCGKEGAVLKTGFFINPSAKKQGALEALFVPQVNDSTIGECVQRLIQCYKKNGFNLSVTKRDKVIVRSYLALRNPNNTGLKLALAKNDLSCDGREFEKVKRFIDKFKPVESPLLDNLTS